MLLDQQPMEDYMRRNKLIVIASALTIAVALGAGIVSAQPNPGPYGGGWYGCHGMMGPGMMGPGMMGPGMMGPGMHGRYQYPTNPTVADVKAELEQWLASMGNPRLKLGSVKARDANTIVADIVTQDGSLVQRFEVDRNTGVYRSV
jgi:hypothetical protein